MPLENCCDGGFGDNLRLSACINNCLSIEFSPPSLFQKMGPQKEDEITPGISASSSAVTDIEELHRHAILQKQSTYIDPPTGFTVFTELAHLKRGKCCGNKCRHCPYGWSNVKSETRLKRMSPKALSGDKEGTRRLVERILAGTYYEDVECPHSFEKEQHRDNAGSVLINSNNTNKRESSMDGLQNESSSSSKLPKGSGQGGYAGGTLTSKNVPYTRKGEGGTSQLFTGERRSKNDAIFEALGTVDELCSVLGVVYAELMVSNGKKSPDNVLYEVTDNSNSIFGELPEQLLEVMSRLFDVGSHIARPAQKKTCNINDDNNCVNDDSNTSLTKTSDREKQEQTPTRSNGSNNEFHSDHTTLLEEWIDTMTDQLPELTSFILPTGSPASAHLHVARTVCRRAERRMVPLVQEEETCDPAALAYVNRLSDYLFTAARFVNYCEERDELQYKREEKGANGGVKDSNFQRERVVVKLKE